MAIGMSGLEQLLQQLDALARPTFLAEVNARLARVTARLVAQEFASGRGPDGTPWAPTLAGGVPLQGLADTFGAEASGPTGFQVGSDSPLAAIHQKGATVTARSARGLRFRVGGRWATKRSLVIPARPILPEGGTPAAWAEAYEREFAAVVAEHLPWA